MMRLYPVGLVLVGLVVAVMLLAPYQSVPYERSDGEWVKLPAPTRLNHTSDTWDYLQLGRQLESGHGFTSLFTYVPFLPESVPTEKGAAVDAFPLFWRQPGFPFMVAGAMTLAGPGEPDALLWLAGVGVVLLPVATYVVARLLVSPGWAALAGLWALLSPAALGASAPLVATTWFAVLLAVLVAAMLRATTSARSLGAGVLLGLTALVRLETWILVPGLFVLHGLSRERGRFLSVAVILGAAILVVLPWHLRLAAITGDPFYNATSLVYHDTETFPGWDSSRTLAVRDLSVVGFLGDHVREVANKSALNFARFGRDLILIPSPFLAPLVWFIVLRLPRERQARAYLIGGVICTASLILVLVPMEYSPRFLAPLVPLLAAAAALAVARMPRFRSVLGVAATVVGVAFLGGFLAGRTESGTAELAARDLNTVMAQSGHPGPRAVALSGAPTMYAWIWNRPAVWAPLPRDLAEVRALLPESFAVFTRATGRGDSVAEDIAAEYAAQGGRLSSSQRPVLVTWPRGATQP
jgi:hypothetical protein